MIQLIFIWVENVENNIKCGKGKYHCKKINYFYRRRFPKFVFIDTQYRYYWLNVFYYWVVIVGSMINVFSRCQYVTEYLFHNLVGSRSVLKKCFHILCKGSMAYFFLTRIRYAVVSCYLHERIAHVKIGIHLNKHILKIIYTINRVFVYIHFVIIKNMFEPKLHIDKNMDHVCK